MLDPMDDLFRRPLRTYVDTSVFGGCLDPRFEAPSRRFFAEVAAGRFVVLLSELTIRELSAAPIAVRTVCDSLAPASLERVTIDQEVLDLMKAYLQVGVLTPRWEEDATHIAAASVAQADLLLSWNFRHIVHVEKIRGFQAVNLLRGYPALDIRSPWEVVHEEGA